MDWIEGVYILEWTVPLRPLFVCFRRLARTATLHVSLPPARPLRKISPTTCTWWTFYTSSKLLQKFCDTHIASLCRETKQQKVKVTSLMNTLLDHVLLAKDNTSICLESICAPNWKWFNYSFLSGTFSFQVIKKHFMSFILCYLCSQNASTSNTVIAQCRINLLPQGDVSITATGWLNLHTLLAVSISDVLRQPCWKSR